MASVEFVGVGKVYPDGTRALEGFDLTIEDGEFAVVLGPSGCGKTTALRMIAGLESVTEGEILIDGNVVNDLEPRDRDIAMVFQNYALYPHMSVFDNLAFGLRARGAGKKEVRERITGVAELLGLADLLHRKPKALSGGQRQRVAMGRAIVREPSVFLMDEPLSNLDAKLRVQMRTEILRMQQRLAATTIFVTHDQTEALTMASKVVVMRSGHVQQVGSPGELYDNPGNLFVASFIGSPSMNFLRGRLMSEASNLVFVAGEQRLEIPTDVLAVRPTIEDDAGSEVIVGFRPEHARRIVRGDNRSHAAGQSIYTTV
jgi:multiple sugar transport system ATP-binding protein